MTKESIDYLVIQKAITGDAEAMMLILDYFTPYIEKLATRIVFDEYGKVLYIMDEYRKRRLETKLMASVLKYKEKI